MKFQYILLSVFGVIGVVAVIVFATAPAKNDGGNSGIANCTKSQVVIWGTYPQYGVEAALEKFHEKYQECFTVHYQYHDPAKFDRDIVEALASKRGPDILLLPDDLILRHYDKIDLIPYQTFPEAMFKEMFAQAGEVFLMRKGIVAYPFAIDPIVMYWNRDIFTNASVPQPPKYWDELLTLAPKLTKRDQSGEVIQSAVAFGEFSNIERAKEILAMLFLQVGNPIVRIDGAKAYSVLAEESNIQLAPNQNAVFAFRFFMDFSNPRKNIYSWNRAKSSARNEFIGGKLGLYFDYASAHQVIAEKNPHLNFAVSAVPQPRDTKAEITYAKVHGLAVLKDARNKQTAATVARYLLTDLPTQKEFSEQFNLPPIRRDLLANIPTDAVGAVFYTAAIRSRTWLDPEPGASTDAFRAAVEAVSSGRETPDGGIGLLHRSLSTLLRDYQL